VFLEGIAFNVPPIFSPEGGIEDFEFHIEEVDMLATIGFIDGRIPHYLPQEPDVYQSIESKVTGLQANLDATNVPIAIQDKIL